MSIPTHTIEHAKLGIDASPLQLTTQQTKACILGAVPPFDTVTSVLHGSAAVLANRVWYYPILMPRPGSFDLLNLGFGATNTGTADTLLVGIYDAISGSLVLERKISFTAGKTASWQNLSHEVGPILPRNMWLGILPELSTNTNASATLTYAATTAVAPTVGYDSQFGATGNPNAASALDGCGRYASNAVVRPTHPASYSFEATMPGSNPVSSALPINMAPEIPAIRLSINST